ANGEFIALSGVSARHLERAVSRLEAQPDIGLIYGDVSVGGESYFARHNVTPLRGSGLYPLLLRSRMVPPGSIVVRASLRSEFVPLPAEAAACMEWWIALRVARVARIELLGGAVAQIVEPPPRDLAFRRW